jgi:hypothetical protein
MESDETRLGRKRRPALLFGLGWPEWLTIIALVAGLWLTLKMMARASVAYEKAREAREQAAEESGPDRPNGHT